MSFTRSSSFPKSKKMGAGNFGRHFVQPLHRDGGWGGPPTIRQSSELLLHLEDLDFGVGTPVLRHRHKITVQLGDEESGSR